MPDFAIKHEDNELLKLVASGNERAFEVLYNEYHNSLGSHLFRVTKSHELSQEIVQDIFLKIWLNRQELMSVLNFKAYLYVVSKNHALNCLKKSALEKTLTTTLKENQDFPTDELMVDNDQYLLIDEAIDRLPPQQKQVYLMSRHERLKYAEIADRLSLSKETVKKYLQLSSDSITKYIRKKLTVSIIAFILYFF